MHGGVAAQGSKGNLQVSLLLSFILFLFFFSFAAVGIKDFILSIVVLEIALGKTMLLNQMK